MKYHPHTVQTRWAGPLGSMILAASPNGLCGIWFADQRHLPASSQLAAWPDDNAHCVLLQTVQQLSAYFNGSMALFDLPLDLGAGTVFQQSVWHALLGIPSGQTTSYGRISQQIDNPQAVRAVGAAVGRNPISIIVPCHRVLGADGSLTGFAGGLARKTALLKLEASGNPSPDLFPNSGGSTHLVAKRVLLPLPRGEGWGEGAAPNKRLCDTNALTPALSRKRERE